MGESETDYRDVVGAAIDVSAEPARFEDLLDVATAFFSERQNAKLIDGETDPVLERRSLQIARLIEDDLLQKRQLDPQPFHAQLQIDQRTLKVTGNPAAQALTGCQFPCSLEELPIDRDTRSVLRSSFLSATADIKDKIVLTTIEEPQVRSCLALIQRPVDSDNMITLSISYIEWSDELLHRLKDAFGLTQSEAEVLAGHLQHKARKDIADERGTTEETVKAQSKAILKKTGSRRMTDVVQLSASIAYLLQAYPQPKSPEDLDSWHTPRARMNTLPRPDGRELAYYRYGSGDAAILYIHGFVQGPFFSRAFLDRIQREGLSLYCPSRPSFGYTSPSSDRGSHNGTVVSDALALVAAEQLTDITVVTHQGGVSHAFRIAAALGSNLRNMVMIDAGIPIDESRHLEKMDRLTRLAGAASKHAPSVMAMMMNLGIPIYKKRGIKAFLEDYLKASPLDLAALEDPETLALFAAGCFHNVQQGSEAWVRDGAAAMANWLEDFNSVSCKQLWIHPDQCPIMQLEFVEEFLKDNPGPALTIIENAGLNVLYQEGGQIAASIADSRQM